MSCSPCTSGHTWRLGDTHPPLRVALKEQTAAFGPLTAYPSLALASSIKLHFRRAETDDAWTERTMVVVDAPNAIVEYHDLVTGGWAYIARGSAVDDFAEAGTYEARVLVYGAGGAQLRTWDGITIEVTE